MLVLSRKKDETLRIGRDIELIILEIEGDRIKVGIKAPKSVSILRGELIHETEALNKEAAASQVPLDALVRQLLTTKER